MLSDSDFEVWCSQLELSKITRTLISQIRTSEPVRRVGGGRSNVCGQYPSHKMGKTIQFESHKVELPAIEAYEADREVLEYYDQPIQLEIEFKSAKGRIIRCKHVPDFLVLRQTNVVLEEWKPEKKLAEIAQKQPHHYYLDGSGHWRNPPAERSAETYGIPYQLRLDHEINWVEYRNRQFLKGYRNGSYSIDKVLEASLIAKVTGSPGITVTQLLQSIHAASQDDINALIAAGKVYTDQSTVSLTEPNKVQLFQNLETAEAFQLTPPWQPFDTLQSFGLNINTPLSWDGKPVTIAHAGGTTIVLRNSDGLVELTHTELDRLLQRRAIVALENPLQHSSSKFWEEFLQASPDDLRIANDRYRILEGYLQGKPLDSSVVSSRTLRRWHRKFKAAQQICNWGYVGLLPHHNAKGNHLSRVSKDAWEFIDQIIDEHYETLQQKGKMAVYGILLREWEHSQRPDPCPSHVTFYRYLKQRDQYRQTKKRKGAKAAYQKAAFYWELKQSTPPHGDRVFEICHIDHTELDIELVCSRTGELLGRPWATILLDAFSRRVLAIYLSFDSPSYRACMMVLRICVQRHERFPEAIVVDHGAEFDSIYFETLLATFNCTKKQRPPARPRFGSVIERFFGTANTQFLHNLRGNTQITKQIRQVTRKNSPKSQAVWNLGELYDHFCQYVYDIYDQLRHPALGQSPRAAFTAGMSNSGSRPQQRVVNDSIFQVLTLPSTPKGTARVQANRGIRVNYLNYWAIDDCFLNPNVEGTDVPVRYDPFDMSTVFAYVNKVWVRCVSEYHALFQGRSVKEIKAVSAELRKQAQLQNQQVPLRAKTIATYLASTEVSEATQLQRLKDLATKDVQTQLQSNVQPADNLANRHPLTHEFEEVTNSDQLSRPKITTAVKIDIEHIQPYADEELWR